MEQTIKLPAECAALSAEEMTYTDGGSAADAAKAAVALFGGVATAVGVAVLGSSYIWGIGQARAWMQVPANCEGNAFTVMGRAVDDLQADMKQSPANFVRDAVSTAMLVTFAPLSAVLIATPKLNLTVPLKKD